MLVCSFAGMAHAEDGPWRSFFESRCVDCHGADVQEGGLRVDSLSEDFSTAEAFHLWVKIHDRVRDGEMPPKDAPQPTADERRKALAWLRDRLSAANIARRQAEGRAVLRRLNRTEYENTLRDLFDLPGLAVRDLLPEDGEAFGFDKSGAGLDLSYVQLAKYMEQGDCAIIGSLVQLGHRDSLSLVLVGRPGARVATRHGGA